MRKRLIGSLSLLILATLVVSVASAQSAPRTIPANDNFANAKPIVIGKNYTVLDIGAATVEPGQPDVALCGSASQIFHSVWFRIIVPQWPNIYLSTEGTRFTSQYYDSVDTVLALFTGGSLPTLAQVACNDDAGTLYSELTAGLQPNVTYYIMVGSFNDRPFDSTSILKLNTRLKSLDFPISNPDFELPLTPQDWKVVNGTGDVRICADPVYPALLGSCMFRFTGNAGESSKLKQTIPFPSYYVPRKNGVIRFGFYYYVTDTALGPVKATFRVNYSDGTPSSKVVVSLTGMAPTFGYEGVLKAISLASSRVSSIGFTFSYRSTTGALLIDFAYAHYLATASTREGVLPPPVLK